MTVHAVKLKVIASIPKDCVSIEDDGWNGSSEELSVTVRGTSFEEAKTRVEEALREQIEILMQRKREAHGLNKVRTSLVMRD